MELVNEVILRKCELGSGMPLLVRAVEPEFSAAESEKRSAEKLRGFYNGLYDSLIKAACRRLDSEEDKESGNTYCNTRRLLDIKLDVTYRDEEYISVLLSAKLVRGARRIAAYSVGFVWRRRDGKLCPPRLFDRKKPNYSSYILDSSRNVVHID